MNFTWDINPATLLAIVGGFVAVLKFVLEARAKAEDACKKAVEACEKIAIIQGSIAAYRETQAERLFSREVLREVEARLAHSNRESEERLAGAIKALGERLDRTVERVLNGKKHG